MSVPIVKPADHQEESRGSDLRFHFLKYQIISMFMTYLIHYFGHVYRVLALSVSEDEKTRPYSQDL